MASTRRKAAPALEKTDEGLVRVYPSPDLPEGSYLPGVGVDGADVAPELAAEWLKAGLATTTPPAED